MKKISILLLATFGCVAFAVSCSESSEKPRETLAGSIYMIGHNFVSDVAYDGEPFVFEERRSYLRAYGESDTAIRMSLELSSDQKTIGIYLHDIPLSGKPFDVTFDCLCSDVCITFDQTHIYDAEAALAGWIKCRDEIYLSTRLSPIWVDYAFEISLRSMYDGRVLTMKIKDPDSE